jgi:hypothetical protein
MVIKNKPYLLTWAKCNIPVAKVVALRDVFLDKGFKVDKLRGFPRKRNVFFDQNSLSSVSSKMENLSFGSRTRRAISLSPA